VTFDVAKGFQVLDSVRLRVGALPQYPSNALNYNLTWSRMASSTNTARLAKRPSMAWVARCLCWRSLITR
jgi:hypothetical protein